MVWNISKHILVGWLIFTALYWICAYYKPFNVDEFFSWVYAQRCTFKEILLLRETGIGHPPFYHLIQKLVQTIFKSYHPFQVRFANYFIGSLFIIAFVYFFSRYKNIPFFLYGVCASATLLDTFVFSRMWGLVCLFSLLLLWTGERYCQNQGPRYLIPFFLTYFLGLMSDYSFILLLPYVVIIVFSGRKKIKIVPFLSLIFFAMVFLAAERQGVILSGESASFMPYYIVSDITKICYVVGNMLFNFWFEEPFLIALLIFVLSFTFVFNKKNIQKQNNTYNGYLILLIFIILIALEMFIKYELMRVRIAILIVFISGLILFPRLKTIHIFDMNQNTNRILITIIEASLVLLSISPFFVRDLKEVRFVLVLFPFALLYVYLICNKKILHTISILFIISGLFYILSKGVSDLYPPPSVSNNKPLIFEDIFSFSNQYLQNVNRPEIPIILNFSKFEKYCKLCRMGTNKIPWTNYDTIFLVGRYDFAHINFIYKNFIVTEKEVNLSWLDKLQFRYFKPIYKERFAIFEINKLKTY